MSLEYVECGDGVIVVMVVESGEGRMHISGPAVDELSEAEQLAMTRHVFAQVNEAQAEYGEPWPFTREGALGLGSLTVRWFKAREQESNNTENTE